MENVLAKLREVGGGGGGGDKFWGSFDMGA